MCGEGSVFGEEEGSRAPFSTILLVWPSSSDWMHSSMKLKFSASFCSLTNGEGKYNKDAHCCNPVI